MNEKTYNETLNRISGALATTKDLSLPVKITDTLLDASNAIKTLMNEVKTLRETLGKEVQALVKAAIASDTAYDATGLAFELGVYAESIFCRLLENDWYEGDPNGEDSKSYFATETDVLKVIKLAETINGGQPIQIETLRSYPIVQMHEWTHLTKEVVLAVREEYDWLKHDLAPENQEK